MVKISADDRNRMRAQELLDDWKQADNFAYLDFACGKGERGGLPFGREKQVGIILVVHLYVEFRLDRGQLPVDVVRFGRSGCLEDCR